MATPEGTSPLVVHGRKILDVRDARPDALLSGSIYAPVSKADATDLPDGVCRFLWVGTAGTANLVQPDGTARANFPLKAGRNDVMVLQVETGGTAADIWACY